MTTFISRFVIASGSFDAINNNLANSIYNASAITSSCNWPGRVWCDVTYTYNSASMSQGISRIDTEIGITKCIWSSVAESGEDVDDVRSIGNI